MPKSSGSDEKGSPNGESPLDPGRMTEIEDYDPNWQFGGGQEWNVSLDTGGAEFRPASVHNAPDDLVVAESAPPEGRPPAPHGPVDSGALEAIADEPRTRELPQRKTLMRFPTASSEEAAAPSAGHPPIGSGPAVDPNGSTLVLNASDFPFPLGDGPPTDAAGSSGDEPVDPNANTLMLQSPDFDAIAAERGRGDGTLTAKEANDSTLVMESGAYDANADPTEAIESSALTQSADHEVSYSPDDEELQGFSSFEFGDTLTLDAESLAEAARQSAERKAAANVAGDYDDEGEDIDFGGGDTLPPPGSWADGAEDPVDATTLLDTSDGLPDIEGEEGADATTLLDTSDGVPNFADADPIDATTLLDTSDGLPDGDGATQIIDLEQADPPPAGATVLLQPEEGVALFDGEKKVSRSVLPEVGELVIDRYEVKRIIGEGGFATVYEAIDGNVGGRVALKVMHAEKSYDEELAERFRQEVTLVRQLRHPNTIKITDAGTTEKGCLFMVAEFLPLETLEEFIEREGAVEPARAIHIVKQILSSLAEAHEMGIVHRDLKPANVMIGIIAGEDDSVKVLDFGIAKALGDDLGSVHTKTGFVFCTPKYAPQEILLSQGVTPAADVYSLGLMFYELLTGQFPVSAQSDAEYIAHQLSPMPNPIPGVLAGTPLGAVLAMSMAKKADDRYPSAGEMLSDVRALEGTTLPLGPIELSAEETRVVETTFDSSNTTAHLPGPGGAVTAQMGPDGQPAPGAGGGMTVMVQADEGRNARMVFLLLLSIFVVMIALWWVLNQNNDNSSPSLAGGPDLGVDIVAPVAERDMGPDESAPIVERRSARQILEARLALRGSRRAGSWLEDDVAVAGATTGTGGQAIVVADIAFDQDRADRLATLYRSADVNSDAIFLIESALEEGELSDEETAAALDELFDATADIVNVMIEADQCGAAERRLDESIANLGEVPPQYLSRVSAMRAEIETCRAFRQELEWDPSSYLALVRQADQHEDDAEDATDEEARRALLFRSVYARQQAIGRLETALASDALTDEQRAHARDDLATLNDTVLSTMMDLDMAVAANAQIDEVGDREHLDDSQTEHLAALRQAMATEDEEEQVALLAPIDEPSTERASAGTGAQARTTVPSDQRPRASSGSGAAAPSRGFNRFRALRETAGEMQAQAYERPTPTEVTPPVEPENTTVAAVETNNGEPDGVQDRGPRGPQEPAVARYRVRINLETNPSGVRVYVNGDYLGRTPINRVIERTEETVTLRLSKTDFREETITLSTLEPEFSRELEMRPENPFGRTGVLSEGGLQRRGLGRGLGRDSDGDDGE